MARTNSSAPLLVVAFVVLTLVVTAGLVGATKWTPAQPAVGHNVIPIADPNLW